MTIALTRNKPQVAIMNAVHDLPVLVARDEGFFKDEGLDLEFVTTPGMAQITTSHLVKFDSVFDRPLDSVYNEGGIDCYRMCEWGIMKRAVEAEAKARNCRQIVLETHSFQAPGFYRKLGFEVIGTVDGYPLGHQYLTLVKRLD